MAELFQLSVSEQLIAEYVAAGEADLVLPLVHANSEYSAFWGIKDLDTETTDTWPNTQMAEYYGVNSIIGLLSRKGGNGMVSVILPAYNEEQMIHTAAKTVSGILETAQIDYQLVFVDDGSRDRTWELIVQESQENIHVTGIHFQPQFWKRVGHVCWLERATGDCCVVWTAIFSIRRKVVEMYRLGSRGQR